MTDIPSPTTTDGPLRRRPSQTRSKERVERILAAATELIAARGSEALRMAEVAEAAEISIGSLYQYFPDKAAIIRTLAERYNLQEQACIQAALDTVRDAAGLRRALTGLVDDYYALFLAEPVMRDIWSGTQADKQLAALELAESRICGGMLAQAMARAHGAADASAYAATAFMIWQLGEATMRLAVSVDETEGAAIVAAFRRMTLREILAPGRT